MKHLQFSFHQKKFFSFILFSIILTSNFSQILSLSTIDLKISTAEYKREYLQSLKFMQKMLLNPVLSSFLEDKEISLHQQVLAQKRLATYYGELEVGVNADGTSQKFKMLFDTGSCEFWIPSHKCFNERCLSHTRYRPSTSLESYNQVRMDIQYLSGHVSGEMVKETIFLGGLEIKNQVIGLAEQIDIPLMNEVIWDGILGLAYPNRNLRNKRISPIIDSIINQDLLHKRGEKNQFAYYLGLNNGAITFGGADMKYKKDMNEEFKWAPIAEKNYWTITLLDIRKYKPNYQESENDIVGNVLCPNGCKTIVDTGTYLIYGPSEQVRTFLSDMKLDKCEDKKNLPTLGLIFKGYSVNGKDSAFELLLTPNDYVLEFESDGITDCVVGLGSDSEDSGWTLGQVFLKAYYTVFDRETEGVGFAKSNPEPGMIIEKNSEDTSNSVVIDDNDNDVISGILHNGPLNLQKEISFSDGKKQFSSFLKVEE